MSSWHKEHCHYKTKITSQDSFSTTLVFSTRLAFFLDMKDGLSTYVRCTRIKAFPREWQQQVKGWVSFEVTETKSITKHLEERLVNLEEKE